MNIHKLIEEELDMLLKEAEEPQGTEQNPLPSLEAFHNYIDSLTPQQLANKRIYYKYSPDTTYVSIFNKKGKQVSTISPEEYEKFAGQEELAKQSLTRRQYAECDLAEFIQEQIKTKVNITNPILIKKLSDKKMGFVTATVANFLIAKAKEKNLKIDLEPIQINQQGFRKACEHDSYKIQEYKKLFNIIPIEDVKAAIQAATTPAAPVSAPPPKDFGAKLFAAMGTPIPTAALGGTGTPKDPFSFRSEEEAKNFIQNVVMKSPTTYADKRLFFKTPGTNPRFLHYYELIRNDSGQYSLNRGDSRIDTLEESDKLRGMILKELLRAL